MCDDDDGAVIPPCAGTNTCYAETDSGNSERIAWLASGATTPSPSPYVQNIADWSQLTSGPTGIGGSISTTGTAGTTLFTADFLDASFLGGGTGSITLDLDTGTCLSGSIARSTIAWVVGQQYCVTADVPVTLAHRGTSTGTGTITGNGTNTACFTATVADGSQVLYYADGASTLTISSSDTLSLSVSYYMNLTCVVPYYAFCDTTGVFTNIHNPADTTNAIRAYFTEIPCGDVPATP